MSICQCILISKFLIHEAVAPTHQRHLGAATPASAGKLWPDQIRSVRAAYPLIGGNPEDLMAVSIPACEALLPRPPSSAARVGEGRAAHPPPGGRPREIRAGRRKSPPARARRGPRRRRGRVLRAGLEPSSASPGLPADLPPVAGSSPPCIDVGAGSLNRCTPKESLALVACLPCELEVASVAMGGSEVGADGRQDPWVRRLVQETLRLGQRSECGPELPQAL